MRTESPSASIASYRLICGVITVMPLVYMAVAYGLRAVGVLPEEGLGAMEPEAESIVGLALVGAGTGSSLLSLFLKKIILGRSSGAEQGPRDRFQATLISLALAESGAVMGLVLMILMGNPLFGSLLCGLSFAITCFHFPSRTWLEHGTMVEWESGERE